jgi:plasmid maintenance system antidote protein VapI
MKDIAMRLKQVEAGDNFTLTLTWEDGTIQTADLSGLVRASRHFKIFAKDPEAFKFVAPINWGHGVGWDNGLDYSAENLGLIAAEQTDSSGRGLLNAFKEKYNLTNDQLAQALGYSRTQIKNFRSGTSPVTYPVRRAISDMMERSALLYARLADNPTK